jgi:hypothetical protein
MEAKMSCFAQLRDNVPTWISDANQLSAHVLAKRAEFRAAASKASHPRKLSGSVKTPSLRTKPARRGLKRILSRDSLSEVFKKRRVEDDALLAMDEPAPAPEPLELAVSYDAHTQIVLEQMVRQIWSAKSSVRSARIAQSMRTTFNDRLRVRLPSYKHDTTPASDAIEVDEDAVAEEAHEEDLAAVKKNPRIRKQSPFDFVEGQLDTAQNLCENGAYRFLRQGNCLDELEGLVRALETIVEASSTMAEQIEAEKATEEEKALARTEKEKEETPIPDVKHPLRDGAENADELNSTILEVDDRSDTSEVSIDISAFRTTRYGQRTLHPFTIARPLM